MALAAGRAGLRLDRGNHPGDRRFERIRAAWRSGRGSAAGAIAQWPDHPPDSDRSDRRFRSGARHRQSPSGRAAAEQRPVHAGRQRRGRATRGGIAGAVRAPLPAQPDRRAGALHRRGLARRAGATITGIAIAAGGASKTLVAGGPDRRIAHPAAGVAGRDRRTGQAVGRVVLARRRACPVAGRNPRLRLRSGRPAGGGGGDPRGLRRRQRGNPRGIGHERSRRAGDAGQGPDPRRSGTARHAGHGGDDLAPDRGLPVAAHGLGRRAADAGRPAGRRGGGGSAVRQDVHDHAGLQHDPAGRNAGLSHLSVQPPARRGNRRRNLAPVVADPAAVRCDHLARLSGDDHPGFSRPESVGRLHHRRRHRRRGDHALVVAGAAAARLDSAASRRGRRLGGWAARTATETGAGVRRPGLVAADGADRAGVAAVGKRYRRAQSGAARAAAIGSGIARRAGRAGSRPPDRHHRARRGNGAAPWRTHRRLARRPPSGGHARRP